MAAGLVGHAGVAVGGAGGDALEQGQHAAHLGHVVEGGDEVHLRGAGVREADVDAGVDERADEGLGAVHATTSGSQIAPGVQDPGGVERRLDAAHELQLGRVLELRRGTGFFSVPMPCSPEMAPPRAMPAANSSCITRSRTSGSPWNTDRWTLPSPAWPQPGDERRRRRRQLGDLGQVRGDRRPGHDHVDDVVRAVGLRRPERLLAGADERGTGGRGEARRRRGRPARPPSSASSSTSSSRRRSVRSSSTTTR